MPSSTYVATTSGLTRAGLLMPYSSDLNDGLRHAGIYAAKIVSGAKPDDLPIEQASKFIFAINLKTATALNITVPPRLLSLADVVIEWAADVSYWHFSDMAQCPT